MKIFRNFLAVVALACAAASAQIVNPSQPATGVPLAGTGISVAGQTVSLNYAIPSSTFTGNMNIGGTLTAGSFAPGSVSTGALTATGAVTGAGFSNLFAIPYPIGSTTPNIAAFTTLSTTGLATLSSETVTGTTTNSGPTILTGTVSGTGIATYEANINHVQTVLNLAALRATSCVPGLVYQTQGYASAADRGAGLYVCNGADTTTADNSFTVVAAANTYRYYLQESNRGFLVDQAGAKGDGATNDQPAIQAAIYLLCNSTGSAAGNGAARLVFGAGKYRMTSGIAVCDGIVLDGQNAGGYPYFNAPDKNSILYFDFGAAVNQWAIDSLTFHSAAGGGGRVLYNEFVDGAVDGTGADGFNSTTGIAIRNLAIVDANASLQTNVPYGALRLVGCPNALIENTSILGFGVGVQLNASFGTKIKNITATTNYYGVLAYNANNNIVIEGEVDQIITPARLTPPAGNIPSWMPSSAAFVSTYSMDGSHNTLSKGVTVAAAQTVGGNSATINITAQYWGDDLFFFNTYANEVQQIYSEGAQTFDVIASTYAEYNVEQLHNFTAAGTYVIDAGYQTVADINVGGLNLSTTFAKNVWTSGNPADPSYVLLHQVNGTSSYVNLSAVAPLFPAHARMTTLYEEGKWTPVIASTTGTLGTNSCTGTYTKNGRALTEQFDCTVTTNGTGSGQITVVGQPYPFVGVINTGSGQEVAMTSKALVLQSAVGSQKLYVTFYDGTYPAASGARLVGQITYWME
jgi:hypothetical protein